MAKRTRRQRTNRYQKKQEPNELMQRCMFDEVVQLEDGTEIRIGFNAEVAEWITKNLKLLEFSRGVDDNARTSTTAQTMSRKAARRSGRKNVSMTDYNDIVRRLQTTGGDARDQAIADMCILGMMNAGGIFTLTYSGVVASFTVEPPFDEYEVFPEYWDERNEQTDEERALIAVGLYPDNQPYYNPDNPFEGMIALCYAIMDENPDFQLKVMQRLEMVIMGIMVGGVTDERVISIFRQALDVLLLDEMGNGNHDEHGADAEGGASANAEDVEPDAESAN